MKAPQRQAIAALAACISGRCNRGGLIDDEEDEVVELSVKKTNDHHEIRDKQLNLILVAENKFLKWSVFDHRTSRYIDLEMSGKYYKGYDYQSSQYFTLQVSDKNICIYDYETDDYHYFHFANQLS